MSYLYGAVILLEPGEPPEMDRHNLETMRSLGMNTAVIWPPVFYRPDKQYHFDRQRQFLDEAAKQQMQVIVELTGQVANLEYLPDSEYRDDYAVLNFDGTAAKMQNGLGELNYHHPAVKRKLKKFFTAAVTALKDHPALFAWDIWNETHFLSFDPYTLKHFRQWAKAKYKTVEAINFYWKKSYQTFSDIVFDQVTWAAIAPDVDWEEFRVQNLAGIAADWCQTVKQLDPKHPVIADNVMSNAVWSECARGTDDWLLAKSADVFGISFYPKTGGRLLKDNTPALRLMTFAGAMAAGGGEFVISELQSHYYSELFVAERVTPGEIICWCLEALTRNCRGIVFWKWAPFVSGFQVGGRGLVLADGSLSKRAEAAGEIGRLLEREPQLGEARVRLRAAILYDRQSKFMVKAINNRIRHLIGDDQVVKAMTKVYESTFERNIAVGFTTPETLKNEHDLQVLFLPCQLNLDAATAQALANFVRRGGTLVANYPFGDIDEYGRLYRNLPGGPLQPLLGAKHLDNLVVNGLEIQELELAPGAEILSSVKDYPLLFCRRHDRGKIIYCAGSLWTQTGFDGCIDRIFEVLLADRPDLITLNADCHVERMHHVDGDFLLVANYQNSPCVNVELDQTYQVKHLYGNGKLMLDGGKLSIIDAQMELLQLLPREAQS